MLSPNDEIPGPLPEQVLAFASPSSWKMSSSCTADAGVALSAKAKVSATPMVEVQNGISLRIFELALIIFHCLLLRVGSRWRLLKFAWRRSSAVSVPAVG